jgi:hypothetical protein
MKKIELIWVVLGCLLLGVAITQCGGETSTTGSPLNASDAGAGGAAPPPAGW